LVPVLFTFYIQGVLKFRRQRVKQKADSSTSNLPLGLRDLL
jgi:hypothetical protein